MWLRAMFLYYVHQYLEEPQQSYSKIVILNVCIVNYFNSFAPYIAQRKAYLCSMVHEQRLATILKPG